MQSEALIELTAEIVSAHVENNAVGAGDLPALIQTVHSALASLGQPVAPDPEMLTPAVPVRSSVKTDAIACLDCGKKLKMLKRHLGADHNLTPAEYRERWGLKNDYPMVAPDYAAKRSGIGFEDRPRPQTQSS